MLFAQIDHQVPITVSGYAGETTLTDFPILVTLATDAPAGFGHSLCAADGADIRFADADGNLVPHEIESWNPSGTSYVWVKVPSLAGTATALTMYFGADDPEHPDPESAVFLPPSGSFANQKPAGD